MIITDIISRETAPLKPSDSVEHALGLLLSFRVRHLPVVDDEGHLVGIISEDQLLDSDGPDELIGSLARPHPLSANTDTHVFDATKIMVEQNLTTLPVVGLDGIYLGLVRRHDIFERFARMLCTQEPGAILALEISPRDYTLSQLIYTIEQTDTKVLSIASEFPTSSDGMIHVTIKLNVTDTTRIRHVLEHYGYRVEASFGEADDGDEILYRVQEFMRYLEV